MQDFKHSYVLERNSEADKHFRSLLENNGNVHLNNNDTLVLRSEQLLETEDGQMWPEGTFKYNILVLKDGETYEEYVKRMNLYNRTKEAYGRFADKTARRLKSGGWI